MLTTNIYRNPIICIHMKRSGPGRILRYSEQRIGPRTDTSTVRLAAGTIGHKRKNTVRSRTILAWVRVFFSSTIRPMKQQHNGDNHYGPKR